MACCCRCCCRDSLSLFRSFSTIFFPRNYSSSWELQLMMQASTKKTSSSIYIICRFVSYFCFLSSVFSHWLSFSVCCKHSFSPFFPSSFCVLHGSCSSLVFLLSVSTVWFWFWFAIWHDLLLPVSGFRKIVFFPLWFCVLMLDQL